MCTMPPMTRNLISRWSNANIYYFYCPSLYTVIFVHISELWPPPQSTWFKVYLSCWLWPRTKIRIQNESRHFLGTTFHVCQHINARFEQVIIILHESISYMSPKNNVTDSKWQKSPLLFALCSCPWCISFCDSSVRTTPTQWTEGRADGRTKTGTFVI